MNKERFGLAAIIFGGILILSCGSGTVSSGGGGGGGNIDPSVVSIISGTLTEAAAPLSPVRKASGTAAVDDYKIIAQALTTRRVYAIAVDGSGEFEFTVPKNDSYTFHILDDTYHYVGPLVLSEYDPEANWVPTGLEVAEDTVSLGNIILSENEYVAVLEEDSLITIDEAMISGAVAGIPAGATTHGMFTGDLGGSAIDLDGDGVINLVDSDDDGDGVIDEFDPDWQPEFSSAVIAGLGLFTNFHNILDGNGDPPATTGDNQYIITIEAIVQGGQEDKISSVAVEGPAYLDLVNYSAEQLSTNWEFYNNKNLTEDYLAGVSQERWGALIQGSAAAHIWEAVHPGDVWIYQITYTDGGTEYTELAARMINFIFTDTPEEVYINDDKWTSSGLFGLPDTVVISWNTIPGLPNMSYEVSGWPIVDDEQYGDGFTYPAGANGDSLVFIFADSIDGHYISAYNIDIVATNANGDNAKTDGGLISTDFQTIEH